MKKVLVTGSAGHLGEALMRTLRADEEHYVVIGTDLIESPFTNLVGTLVDPNHVRRCMQDGIDIVFHTATLHKPHIETHTNQEFVDTNVTGTLNLLEEAVRVGVKAFIFTSTTSTFGDAMAPKLNEAAVWINEKVEPIAKNIYGITKLAAENLCSLFARKHKLPCLVLRTSRFFLEADDNRGVRDSYEDLNIKANEIMYRRVDIEDIVAAHLLAAQRAKDIGFARYIISATTPFSVEDLSDLRRDPGMVMKRQCPEYEAEYARRSWRAPDTIDRVYDNSKAREELGWSPKYDFRYVLGRLAANEASVLSPLALKVGVKGYHPSTEFAEGPYPVS